MLIGEATGYQHGVLRLFIHRHCTVKGAMPERSRMVYVYRLMCM